MCVCVYVRRGGSLPPLGLSYWLPNVQMLKPVYVQKYVGTVTKCSDAKASVSAKYVGTVCGQGGLNLQYHFLCVTEKINACRCSVL